MGDVRSIRRALPAMAVAIGLLGALPALAGAAEGLVRVSGVVRDPAERPIGEARVIAYDEGGAVEGTTAADGSYALDTSPGTGRFYVEAGMSSQPGLPPVWEFVSDFLALEEDRALDVRLPPTAAVTVRVVGSDGEPIAGADVRLPFYRREHVDAGGASGWVETFSRERNRELQAQTDADGEAHFTVFDGSLPWREGDGDVAPPEGSGDPPRAFPAPDVRGDTTYVVQYGSADSTPPTVACDPPPSGWYAEEVSVACRASDDGSGLANEADASFALSTDVGEGHATAEAQTGTHRVCDQAGNCVTAGPVGPIMVDRAPPEILFQQATDGLDSAWWVHSPVAIEVFATDANGVASFECTLDGGVRGRALRDEPLQMVARFTAVRGEGRHRVDCTATDGLGHTGSASEFVRIDLTPPSPATFAAERPPDYAGGGGWYADSVTVTTLEHGDPPLADDSPGSGVDPASVPAPQTFTASGRQRVSVRFADVAGNRSRTASATFKVDADPPATILTCPAGSVRAGARAHARWRDTDGESGLATSASGTIALDTAAAGTFTVQHTATDNVGHSATSSCTYSVG